MQPQRGDLMSVIDTLIRQIVLAKATQANDLGLDDARRLYNEVTSNADLDPTDLLPYFQLFDSRAQRLLCCLFDPRYKNLVSSSQTKPTEPSEKTSALSLQIAEMSAAWTIDSIPYELPLEVFGFSPSLLYALTFGNGIERLGADRVSVFEAYTAYRYQMAKYQQTDGIEELISATHSLIEAADKISSINLSERALLDTLQRTQISLYEEALRLCDTAKRMPACRSSEYLLDVYRMGKGLRYRMDMLDELRKPSQKDPGNSNGGVIPEGGQMPMGPWGANNGVAAAPLCAPFVANSFMTSSALLCSSACPVLV
jgi:hypothetical protein